MGGGGFVLLRVHKKFKLIYFGPENSENLLNTGSHHSCPPSLFGLIEAHAHAPGIVISKQKLPKAYR